MTTIVTAAELAGDVEAFLRFKRAMGAPYRRGQWDLERFVHFVARQWGERGEVPLDEAIRRWCERIPGRKAVTLGNEFGPIRGTQRLRADPKYMKLRQNCRASESLSPIFPTGTCPS
jgi:hypothetical protein